MTKLLVATRNSELFINTYTYVFGIIKSPFIVTWESYCETDRKIEI